MYCTVSTCDIIQEYFWYYAPTSRCHSRCAAASPAVRAWRCLRRRLSRGSRSAAPAGGRQATLQSLPVAELVPMALRLLTRFHDAGCAAHSNPHPLHALAVGWLQGCLAGTLCALSYLPSTAELSSAGACPLHVAALLQRPRSVVCPLLPHLDPLQAAPALRQAACRSRYCAVDCRTRQRLLQRLLPKRHAWPPGMLPSAAARPAGCGPFMTNGTYRLSRSA